MNNDYLRVNSKEEQEGVTEGKYAAKAEVKNENSNGNTTLFSLFNFKKAHSKDTTTNFSVTAKVFLPFVFAISAAMFLLLVAFVVKGVELLIIASLITAVIMPLLFMSFFYELNSQRNVSAVDILCGLVIGIAYFVLIAEIYEHTVSYLNNIERFTEIIFAVISDLGLFLISLLFVRVPKKANVFGSMLLVISVFSGFVFARTAIVVIDSLFTSAQIGTDNPYPVLAIIRSGEYFDKVVSDYVVALIKFGIYESFLYFTWAIIIGGVIVLRMSPVKVIYRDSSLYLLIALQILLNILLVIGSSLLLLSIILNVACVVLSLIVSVKVLNYIISTNVTK